MVSHTAFKHNFSHITATPHIFMYFLGITNTRLALWSVLPKSNPHEKPSGSSKSGIHRLKVTNSTIYIQPCRTRLCEGRKWRKCCIIILSTVFKSLLIRIISPLTKQSQGEKPFQNIVGKGENAGSQHFLLFQQCFYPKEKLVHRFPFGQD